MKLADIIRHTEANLVVGSDLDQHDLKKAFSSDLMSDVLTLDIDNILLITGLTNPQLIRTAEIADIGVVLLARNKKASAEMIELAREVGVILLETPYSIYRASGILYKNGLEPVY